MKHYPWFNTEGLIRGKPNVCNCAVQVAIACEVNRMGVHRHVHTVESLFELKTRVRLKAGFDVDLCCLMQLLKDWSGNFVYKAVLAVVSRTSENWFVLYIHVAVASYLI